MAKVLNHTNETKTDLLKYIFQNFKDNIHWQKQCDLNEC